MDTLLFAAKSHRRPDEGRRSHYVLSTDLTLTHIDRLIVGGLLHSYIRCFSVGMVSVNLTSQWHGADLAKAGQLSPSMEVRRAESQLTWSLLIMDRRRLYQQGAGDARPFIVCEGPRANVCHWSSLWATTCAMLDLFIFLPHALYSDFVWQAFTGVVGQPLTHGTRSMNTGR